MQANDKHSTLIKKIITLADLLQNLNDIQLPDTLTHLPAGTALKQEYEATKRLLETAGNTAQEHKAQAQKLKQALDNLEAEIETSVAVGESDIEATDDLVDIISAIGQIPLFLEQYGFYIQKLQNLAAWLEANENVTIFDSILDKIDQHIQIMRDKAKEFYDKNPDHSEQELVNSIIDKCKLCVQYIGELQKNVGNKWAVNHKLEDEKNFLFHPENHKTPEALRSVLRSYVIQYISLFYIALNKEKLAIFYNKHKPACFEGSFAPAVDWALECGLLKSEVINYAREILKNPEKAKLGAAVMNELSLAASLLETISKAIDETTTENQPSEQQQILNAALGEYIAFKVKSIAPSLSKEAKKQALVADIAEDQKNAEKIKTKLIAFYSEYILPYVDDVDPEKAPAKPAVSAEPKLTHTRKLQKYKKQFLMDITDKDDVATLEKILADEKMHDIMWIDISKIEPNNGQFYLHYLLIRNKIAFLEKLFIYPSFVNDVVSHTDNALNFLQLAAQHLKTNECYQVVKPLLDAVIAKHPSLLIDVTARGLTPLHLAIENNNVIMVKYLLVSFAQHFSQINNNAHNLPIVFQPLFVLHPYDPVQRISTYEWAEKLKDEDNQTQLVEILALVNQYGAFLCKENFTEEPIQFHKYLCAESGGSSSAGASKNALIINNAYWTAYLNELIHIYQTHFLKNKRYQKFLLAMDPGFMSTTNITELDIDKKTLAHINALLYISNIRIRQDIVRYDNANFRIFLQKKIHDMKNPDQDNPFFQNMSAILLMMPVVSFGIMTCYLMFHYSFSYKDNRNKSINTLLDNYNSCFFDANGTAFFDGYHFICEPRITAWNCTQDNYPNYHDYKKEYDYCQHASSISMILFGMAIAIGCLTAIAPPAAFFDNSDDNDLRNYSAEKIAKLQNTILRFCEHLVGEYRPDQGILFKEQLCLALKKLLTLMKKVFTAENDLLSISTYLALLDGDIDNITVDALKEVIAFTQSHLAQYSLFLKYLTDPNDRIDSKALEIVLNDLKNKPQDHFTHSSSANTVDDIERGPTSLNTALLPVSQRGRSTQSRNTSRQSANCFPMLNWSRPS